MSADDDLAAFLTARYGEAEAVARGVDDHSEPWPGQWKADSNLAVRTYNGHVLAYSQHGEFKPGFAAYVADNDPAHRLADIALKRAVLALHATETTVERRGLATHNCVICGWFHGSEGGCATVRQLGTEFSDHPDYKPGWAPEG